MHPSDYQNYLIYRIVNFTLTLNFVYPNNKTVTVMSDTIREKNVIKALHWKYKKRLKFPESCALCSFCMHSYLGDKEFITLSPLYRHTCS